MSRIGPIAPEQMTPEQASIFRAIEAKGGRLGGPYTAYIRIPEFMRLNQDMGDYLRRNSLSPRLRSLVVLKTVGHWGAKYAWAVNKQSALKGSVEPAVIDAIEQDREPPGLDAKDRAALQVAVELLTTKQVSDATYRTALELFGENGVADIVATTGFYSMVSMTLNAFEIDPPRER
jgi:4-carboxymuconolactone decarboxylase